MAVVYTVAFTKIMRAGSEGFVFYLMLGLLAWTFFANSAGDVDRIDRRQRRAGQERLVPPRHPADRDRPLQPRPVHPDGAGVPAVDARLLSACRSAAPMLLFPVFVGLQSLFTIGVALILATSTAFFRDVRHLVDVGLAVCFWATPIVYELGRPATGLRRLVFFSPLSPYVSAYHDIFYYRQWPDGADLADR